MRTRRQRSLITNRRGASTALLGGLALLLAAGGATARPPVDPRNPGDDPGEGTSPPNAPASTLDGQVRGSVTYPTEPVPIGSVVVVDGHGKIEGRIIGSSLERVAGVPNDEWDFDLLSKPGGSVLSLTSSYGAAHFTPDVPGDYIVRATACPGRCKFLVGDMRVIAPETPMGVFVIRAVGLVPAPSSEVLSPIFPASQRFEDPAAMAKCSGGARGGAGWVNPQWVTINPLVNHQPAYVLLEGTVGNSIMSSLDNFLNHDSHDWKIPVNQDPKYEHLLRAELARDDIHVEWESDELPELFRPAFYDRVSVVGFHIYDCGHDVRAEVHPPVLVAVHRARPVQLPADAMFDLDDNDSNDADDPFDDAIGAGAWAPGIVSDVFASRDSGEATSCMPAVLHEPADPACIVAAAGTSGGTPIYTRHCSGDCVGRPNINRKFTYSIHLPENPGRHKNRDVPLYVKLQRIPGYPDGPAPSFEPRYDSVANTYYLDVTADLSEYHGSKWAYRVVAAWVYADKHNFGLERWQVSAESVSVTNDADWFPFDDGDWRLHARSNSTNTMNGFTGEWFRLIKGTVSDDQTLRYGDSRWNSSRTTVGGRFTSDAFLFPDQRLDVHMDGYDDDSMSGDELGRGFVELGAGQRIPGNYEMAGSHWKSNVGLQHGEAIPLAALSSVGAAFMSQYRTDAPLPPKRGLDFDRSRIERSSDTLAPAGGRGRGLLGEVSDTELAERFASLQASSPQRADEFLAALRAQIDRKVSPARVAGVRAHVDVLRAHVPPAVWSKHFASLP